MNDLSPIEKLFEGWERAIQEYEEYPCKGKHDDGLHTSAIAERGMSWSAYYETYYRADPLLEKIHYDFGLLEALHGLKAKKLWHMQAKRIKKARRHYGIK